eukprot:8045919-Pyramimonas_sp.AAC.2
MPHAQSTSVLQVRPPPAFCILPVAYTTCFEAPHQARAQAPAQAPNFCPRVKFPLKMGECEL